MRTWKKQVVAMAVCMGVWGQAPKGAAGAVPVPVAVVEQPEANRTKEELSRLLERYPPTLRNVLSIDHALLGNPAYLAPYPALASFLNAHPEIARNPGFYIGERHEYRPDPSNRAFDFVAGCLCRVGRVHGSGDGDRGDRLADPDAGRLPPVEPAVEGAGRSAYEAAGPVHGERRFAGLHTVSGGVEVSGVVADQAVSGPRSVGAPLGRILWSLQGGLVLMAAGIGMQIVSGRVRDEAGQPLQALGVLAVALGIGFLISAIISYLNPQGRSPGFAGVAVEV